MTHIGIGFAENNFEVKVVELISEKPVSVSQVGQSEDGGVEIRGVVLNPAAGLYAARIYAKSNNKKDIAVVGPAAITLDKTTHQF